MRDCDHSVFLDMKGCLCHFVAQTPFYIQEEIYLLPWIITWLQIVTLSHHKKEHTYHIMIKLT